MSLLQHQQFVPDPRVQRTHRHDLIDLLAIALCATVGEVDNWVEVAQFGQAPGTDYDQRLGGRHVGAAGTTRCAGLHRHHRCHGVPDPRMLRTQRHELLDILAVALCAVIGGADHWTEVVEFGESKLAWFSTFLKLPNGIASHDTFARVFHLLDTDVLEKACQQWLASLVGRVEGVVAINGKSVRGSRDGKRHPLHIVSAWASHHGLLLGQVRTAEKSNEITAIPELLKLLSIQAALSPLMPWAAKRPLPRRSLKARPTMY